MARGGVNICEPQGLCKTDSECAKGEMCVCAEGTDCSITFCATGPLSPLWPQSFEENSPEQKTTYTQCKSDPLACIAQPNCSCVYNDGESVECEFVVCWEGPHCTTPCEESSQCGECETCKDGECTQAEECKGCSSNLECVEGCELCLEGQCVPTGACTECVEDSDCKGDCVSCVSGVCQSNAQTCESLKCEGEPLPCFESQCVQNGCDAECALELIPGCIPCITASECKSLKPCAQGPISCEENMCVYSDLSECSELTPTPP